MIINAEFSHEVNWLCHAVHKNPHNYFTLLPAVRDFGFNKLLIVIIIDGNSMSFIYYR